MNGNYERYREIEDADVVEVVDDKFGASCDSALPYGGTALFPWSRARLAAKMEIAHEVSNSRAILAKQALQNLAVLSKEEEVLAAIAPSGAARYKAIVDSVALSDAILISQTRW